MATTKSITVRKRLDNLLNYIVDADKTSNPDFDRLGNVIDYATDANKTGQKQFVTGINCAPETAYSQMQKVMLLNDKPSPVIGYHFIQSFAPGESDPATVHRIGVELADRLFGKRFMCVVATHQNTDCLHNHIALCPTSFIDGRRYHSCKASYRELQKASDALCCDFGLSVIENPQRGRSKSYGEHKAEREGKPTWRSIIKTDVDEAIARAGYRGQFVDNLRAMGYGVKVGNQYSVRPQGKERFIRLERSLGSEYSIEAIRQRLYYNKRILPPVSKPNMQNDLAYRKLPKWTRGSILSTYRRWLWLIGYYQQRTWTSSNARMHYLLREDIRKLDTYIAQTRLLGREEIHTLAQLDTFRNRTSQTIEELERERRKLYRITYKSDIASEKEQAREHISEINTALKPLRKDCRLAEDISDRWTEVQDRINQVERDVSSPVKMRSNEVYRR